MSATSRTRQAFYDCHPEPLFWANDLPRCLSSPMLRTGFLARIPGRNACAKAWKSEASRTGPSANTTPQDDTSWKVGGLDLSNNYFIKSTNFPSLGNCESR